MSRPMDPGVLEAVLALADASEDANDRDDVMAGYEDSGYMDLADAVDRAWRTLDSAELILTQALGRMQSGTWMFRDGEEL